MASPTRKRHSVLFKFKVALEAAQGTKTTNELAGQYGLHPTQISHWKRQFMVRSISVCFSNVVNGIPN